MGMKTSLVAMFCAVTGLATGAYAAPSVRVIGGGNTYTSAAAASTNNKDTGDTASRAGSLRVMPAARTTSGTTKSATLSGSKTTPNTTTVGRAVTTPRLSVGKYIGTSIPKSVSSANLSGDLTGRLDTIEANIQNLKMDKQDNISGTEFITVTNNNEVMLEVDALKAELEGIDGQDGKQVEIGRNVTHILWRYEGDPEWQELIALDELRGTDGVDGAPGEKGDKGDKGDPGEGADLTLYSTTEQMNSAIAAAVAAIDLSNYYTKSETYSQGETDTAIATAIAGIDLSGKVDVALGTGKENKVLVTDASGNVTADDIAIDASGLNINDTDTAKASMPTGYAVNQKLKAKADADNLSNVVMSESGVLVAGNDGKISASADYATKTYVNNAIENIDVTDLGFGALAREDTVRNELIDNSTIERGKLATNIQEALTTIMDEAPSDGQYVLSHTPDGGLVWTPVQQ